MLNIPLELVRIILYPLEYMWNFLYEPEAVFFLNLIMTLIAVIITTTIDDITNAKIVEQGYIIVLVIAVIDLLLFSITTNLVVMPLDALGAGMIYAFS